MSLWGSIKGALVGNLTPEACSQIDAALCDCIEAESDYSGSAGGSHYMLIATLNNFGIKCNSSDEAKRIAEAVVSRSY